MVQMNWFAGQKLRHRCREQMYRHQAGKAAGGGCGAVMNWEIGIDIYTLMCIKLMSNKNMLYKKINKIKLKNKKKCQNLWYAGKAFPRGKFVMINAYSKKQKKISNKQPEFTPEVTRRRTN